MTHNNVNGDYADMSYDVNRFVFLLKKQQDLKKKGKILSQENRQDYEEIIYYHSRLSDQIYYLHKEEYFWVLHDYLMEGITLNDLMEEFLKLNDGQIVGILEENFDQLVTFKVDLRSKGFNSVIEEMSKYFECGFEGEDTCPILMERIFFRIQDYMN